MAQILSFRTPELRSDDGPDRHRERSAEVILFPGVRYERWEDAAQAAEPRRAMRDVIELADQ